ncbi:hypothetical protein BDN72DRAFT_739355, partial [Pluteus cervinus]
LNIDQRRAYDIVQDHLERYLAKAEHNQLLMFVYGEGGTGKSRLIHEIAQLFAEKDTPSLLAKTATTGVASGLIDGTTVHSWVAMPIIILPTPGQASMSTSYSQKKRSNTMTSAAYLIIDEVSMM